MKKKIKYILTITLCLLDLLIKYYIENNITYIEVTSFFSLNKVHNYGVAFNIFNDKRIFIIILSIILLLLFIYMEKDYKDNLFNNISFGLIYAGILGNLINRITLGYVIDYISILSFPIFNLADICICIGIFFLIIGGIYDSRRR